VTKIVIQEKPAVAENVILGCSYWGRVPGKNLKNMKRSSLTQRVGA
jgi:hypothetical protein